MIYFDNAATSYPKAPDVASALASAILNIPGNAGRSSFKHSLKTSEIIFDCRERIARMFNIEDSENVIFTSGATEALNLLIHGLAEPGGRVLTSPMEHNSVLRPLEELRKRQGLRTDFVKCDKNGLPDLEDWKEKLRLKPEFAVVTAASNVTGSVFPFYEMAKTAHQENIPFILDTAQAAGTVEIDCGDEGISAACFAGHKGLLGPGGIGFCYISEKINPRTLKQGGTGSRSDEPLQPEFRPDKYEAGTQNITCIAGLNAALKFIEETGIVKIKKRKKELFLYFTDSIKKIKSLTVHADANIENTGIISVSSDKLTSSELTEILNKYDIAVRTGLHCAPEAHKAIGTFEAGGAVRFSLGYFNTEKEIDYAINLLEDIHKEEK